MTEQLKNYELIDENKVKIELSKLDLVKILYLSKLSLYHLTDKFQSAAECMHSIEDNNFFLRTIADVRELIKPALVALSEKKSDEKDNLDKCGE